MRPIRRTALAVALVTIGVSGCSHSGSGRVGDTGDAAKQVYVGPGKYDEFYAFMSGGFDGQVGVYGLPSGRLLRHVPVFSQNAENGWGYSEQTKPMFATSYGFVPWDDAHHPELSQSKGVPDGRWLFINGNNTPRIARLDLTRFETEEILEIPNSAGNHSSPFVTENSEYVVAGTRFSVPVPQRDVSIDEYKDAFSGVLSFVRVDSVSGHMKLAFQIKLPAFDYDLSHSGKGPSHGWSFFTSYNSEEGNSKLEVQRLAKGQGLHRGGQLRAGRKQCVAQSKAKSATGPLCPQPDGRGRHRPHRMGHQREDADAGRLPRDGVLSPDSQVAPRGGRRSNRRVHRGRRQARDGDPGAFLQQDAEGHRRSRLHRRGATGFRFSSTRRVVAGEVQNPGLGPLHTEFDGKGNAYTSMFISSEIVKWSLKDFKVLDRAPTYYSIGHLMIPGGDSRKPWGKYVVALNKITKDRYLPTGPELAQSAQLYDISGSRMKLLLDFPTIGEPHYAQALPAELITRSAAQDVLPQGQQGSIRCPLRDEDQSGPRKGNVVDVLLTSVRSHFMPDKIEGIQPGRHRLLPRDEPGAGLGRAARLRHHRARNSELLMHAGTDPYPDVGAPAASACFPSTAPTSARRCTRRCKGMCGSRPAARSWSWHGTARPGRAGSSRN